MALHANTQPTVTSLRAGESLQTTLRAGTRILVHKGEVLVSEPPLWLADTIVPVRTMLAEGGGHRVAATGCITLSASADAQVHHWEPASQWQLASDWVLSRAEVLLVRAGVARRA
jgi:hypothetical protein